MDCRNETRGSNHHTPPRGLPSEQPATIRSTQERQRKSHKMITAKSVTLYREISDAFVIYLMACETRQEADSGASFTGGKKYR